MVPLPASASTSLRGGISSLAIAATNDEEFSLPVGDSNPRIAAGFGFVGATGMAGAAALVFAAARMGRRRETMSRRTQCRAEAQGKKKISEIKVGDKFDGVVTRVANIGVWFNIGAEKEALWQRASLPPDAQFAVGQKLTDLEITEVSDGETPRDRKIRVKGKAVLPPVSKAGGAPASKRKAFKVGDTVDGVVKDTTGIGLMVDIGAGRDALFPQADLPEGATYEKGTKITGLRVSEVGAQGRIRVTKIKLPSDFKVGDIVDAKVVRAADFGVFVNAGCSKDFLLPRSQISGDMDDIKPGDSIKVKVIDVKGQQVSVSTNLSEAKTTATVDSSSLNVGDVVDGTVTRFANFGIFMNIGASRDALCRDGQLAKGKSEYNVGDKVTGLKIAAVDAEKGLVDVTMRRLTSEVKEDDKLEGQVVSVTRNAVFFDAGLTEDVAVPARYLSKDIDSYKEGEVADLQVLKVEGARITASTQSDEELGVKVETLVRGNIIKGKVTGIDPNIGVFINIGARVDALLRPKSCPKPITDYQVGEELDNLMISKVDVEKENVEVRVEGYVQDVGKPLEEFSVGEEVDGTIVRVAPFGLFMEIGAEREALYPLNQLSKPINEYKVGDVIEGLKVAQVDPDKRQLAVSLKKSIAELEVGQEVTGIVTKVLNFGVFVDVGASTEALVPTSLLARDLADYKAGDELTDLTVASIDASAGKLTLKQAEPKGEEGMGMDDLEEGMKVNATVKQVKDYGCFVDIGLNRRDALLPAALLDGKELDEISEGDTFEVFIHKVQRDQNRVTVGMKEPEKKSEMFSFDGELQPGYSLPGQGLIEKMNPILQDNDPPNFVEWCKKYPKFIRIAPKPVMVYESTGEKAFSGVRDLFAASSHYIPIPVHLRKPDAIGEEMIPDKFVEKGGDYEVTYDVGIKQEIHCRHRQPPFSNPNRVDYKGKDDRPTKR